MDTPSRNHANAHGRSAGRWVFWGFALVASYFLYTEHRAHLLAALPYLLLAACPLMHLFHHHGGHRHHHGGEAEEERGRPEANRDPAAGRATWEHHDR